MKNNNEHYTIGTHPKYNRTIIETGKIDAPSIHTYDRACIQLTKQLHGLAYIHMTEHLHGLVNALQ